MSDRKKMMLSIFFMSVMSVLYVFAQEAAPSEVPQIAIERGIEEEKIAHETGVYQLEGIASYYGDKFHNKITANGETFNMNAFTAAHRTLPFHTVVEVTNVLNGRTVTVRINDRGPYLKNRVIDLSKEAAEALGMIKSGTAPVTLSIIHMGKKKVREIKSISGLTEYHADHVVNIQVASYSNVENAQRLIHTLTKLNFKSSIERYNGYYRVMIDDVGPVELNDEVLKLKKLGFKNLIIKDVEY